MYAKLTHKACTVCRSGLADQRFRIPRPQEHKDSVFMSKELRTVSGMRPTGPLHLGHYFGVLKNWVDLQNREEAYFFVADWHALTSDYADPSRIRRNIEEMVKDWVAAGLGSAKMRHFPPIRGQGTRRTFSLAFHDHAGLLAGAQPHL